VADLKKLLKEKRLSTVGNKAELIARLETGGGSSDAEHVDTSHEEDEDLLEDVRTTLSQYFKTFDILLVP